MSNPTIKDAIERAIKDAGGRAELKQIYETVVRLKPLTSKTPQASIRTELYRGRSRFRQNKDGTWSLGRSTVTKRILKDASSREEAQRDSSVITNSGIYMPYQYRDEDELEKNVESKAREVFGPNSFYFPLKWKVESTVGARHIDGLVLNLADSRKPEAQIVEYETVRDDLRHIESQIRDFHRALKDDATLARIVRKAYEELKRSPRAFQKAKGLAGKDSDLYSIIDEAISENHSILVVVDDLFPNKDFDYPKRLKDRLADIETNITVLEFKTFTKNHELVHFYRFPTGR